MPPAAWRSTAARSAAYEDSADDKVAIGGSGFGIMALIVAVERGWVTRDAALERLRRMLDALLRATRYHGAFPHFIDGASGATIPMSPKDDAADLVETSFLVMGLLCARQYFSEDTAAARRLRGDIDTLWHERRMGLVHPGRTRRPVLALEPEQRLGDEP